LDRISKEYMSKRILVSFSGAQSSGKTTLLRECWNRGDHQTRSNDFFDQFDFVPEVTRLVKVKLGVNINEQGDNMTQLCIINQHLENYLIHTNSNKSTIMDRCILDGLIYTQYMHDEGKVDCWVLGYARCIYEELIKKIDIIFYTDPSIPLVDDGERSTNDMFRAKITDHFDQYIKGLKNVVVLKGSVEERMLKLRNTLNKKLN
jgi:nicotinamide riboside kinase